MPTDLTPMPTTADPRELAVSGGLSGLSLGSAMFAMLQSFPLNGAIAVAGVVASALIQVVRMVTDSRIARLTSDLLHAQAAHRAADAREAVHLDRIATLVAQRDAAHDRVERLSYVLIQHIGDIGPDARQAIAEVAKEDKPKAVASVETPVVAPAIPPAGKSPEDTGDWPKV